MHTGHKARILLAAAPRTGYTNFRFPGIFPMSKDNGLRDTRCIMNVTTSSSLRSAFQTSLGGVQNAVKTMNKAAKNIADGDVDADQVVTLSQAAILAKANALAARSEDETYGSLLKTLA